MIKGILFAFLTFCTGVWVESHQIKRYALPPGACFVGMAAMVTHTAAPPLIFVCVANKWFLNSPPTK